MKLFKNLKISVKILAGFGIVLILILFMGTIAVTNINRINNDYTEVYQSNVKAFIAIGNVLEGFERQRINYRNILLARNSAEMNSYLQKVDEINDFYKTNLEDFSKLINEEDIRQEYQKLNSLFDEYDKLTNQIIELAKSDKKAAVDLLFKQSSAQLVSDVQNSIKTLYDLEKKYIEKLNIQNNALAKSTVTSMVIIVILCIAISLFIGLVISYAISRPISKMVLAAQKIAEGDLTVDVSVDSKDEIGILSEAFSKMIESLSQLIYSVKSSAEQVALGAKQLADASQSLAQGATDQASSIEELNASIEEVSAQTKQNSKNVEEATNFANQIKDDAKLGMQQMEEMMKAMEEINAASSNISKIIKTIDEIAFQTNILALNAAVEAARAGSYGKGFAVVAEEVRNLATRSANAAKETSSLIESTIKKIEVGDSIAKQTYTSLDRITKNIDKMAMIMNDIMYSSKEQSEAIAQITEGINQVANVVQSNSANSQETAAASEELFSQADVLKNLVERFKTRS
ncbi:methyl-accepting chemotaxis sensory transducer [Caldicellulosiruptor kronotskyensis 2002]|uniref:Methyl-accepting chemotaxis sensory transducer n=1 Tax=Caldicellulosiruptor kronotskyensis (strain DSM 18902 / VKM B-2412 / 2002) TaxID=632348 RepID=E4SDR7_CALK2|nr:methyl-accepting chemotaxis protein [Caldicellulosiruptor kronotskyensis]ADQ45818.1 methyl-accepting chemotaxis sensory transducer [Caldicellulosiruptor kronotskyensis 2002]